MKVRLATHGDIRTLTYLFDRYRQFYGQNSDESEVKIFLAERFTNGDSVILLAEDDENCGSGFTQLYPSFSSVSMARAFILNDLFVAEGFRRRGVGSMLLDSAVEYGRSVGAIRLTLSTAHENVEAQTLYHAHGWEKDKQYCVFHKKI